MPSHDQLLVRIRGEYAEMPGLRLTLTQACRLWHLDEVTCRRLLEQLVAERILHQQQDGSFAAFPSMRPKPLKAALPASPRPARARRRS